MKSVPVVALEPVRDDVQIAYDYFEERLPGEGDRFLRRYFSATDRIALNPAIFSLTFEDYRRALVPRSNIAVYYFVEPERAVIVAVIDARRNPRLLRRLVCQRRGLV
jgi:plasmid stabilization system protein ParE